LPLPTSTKPETYIASSSSLDSVVVESIRETTFRKIQSYRKKKIQPFSLETKNKYPATKNQKILYLTDVTDELLVTMKCKPDIKTLLIPFDKYISLAYRITDATLV